MYGTTLLSAATALIALAHANPIPQAAQAAQPIVPSSASGCSSAPVAKAVYFMTNPVNAPNELYALTVGKDGQLADGQVYKTGGNGANIVAPNTNTPIITDGLSSSNAVLVHGHRVYAVNAGSSTISIFAINPAQPTQLFKVSEVPTLGDFPVSMAVSKSLNQLCVANTGKRAGVACFAIESNGLFPITPLYTFALDQTNPPSNAVSMVTDNVPEVRSLYTSIQFTADETMLLATVTDGTPGIPGYIMRYPVENGVISPYITKMHTPGSTQFFTSFSLPNSNTIFALDIHAGSFFVDAAVQNFGNNLTANTPIPGSKIACWAKYADTTGSIYVTDPLTNRLVEVDSTTGDMLGTYNATDGKLGMLDLDIAGNSVYALSPSSNNLSVSVVVFDISGGATKAKLAQDFIPSGVGNVGTAQGIALYL
ncbi:hypothetical protein MMC25_004354 [Agyrium rufum]|nr:hypothetical protein [Agyrium rufum]